MIRRVIAALLLCLTLALGVPSAALAEGYTIDDVTINATLDPDATLRISEDRTMTFDGDFSRVYWILEKAGTQEITIEGVSDDNGTGYAPGASDAAIEDRSQRVPGTYLVRDTGDAVEVHVFHDAANDTRAFRLVYSVTGAATRWSDTSEFYWQFIGDGWAEPTGSFLATLNLPGELTKSEVKAWAHGPLTGTVTITDTGVIELAVDDVPANTFVEVRTAFPAESLASAPVVDEAMLDTILAEEAALAEEANSERTWARVLYWGGGVLTSLIGLAAFGYFLIVFLRHGKEHAPAFTGQYFREDPRPDLHPAVIGALWRFGKVEDTDVAATLMNLADNGVITMTPVTVSAGGLGGMFGKEEQSFQLDRVPGKSTDLSELDRKLMGILFDDIGRSTGRVTLEEIKAYAKSDAQTFAASMSEWKALASATAEQQGFFEVDSQSWQVGAIVGAVIVAVLGVFVAIWTGGVIPAVIPVISAIGIAVLAAFMQRRSTVGAELYATYKAVHDFLRDFSRLHEAPPASVILWNRFLVLAVVFGIAEQVIEQLRVKLPEVVQDPAFQTSYWWAYSHGGYGHSPVSALSSSFVSAASIAQSQMSSASGGGGGFSGGGGFGGGGGGGGAD